ncbi:hypothetical protein Tco_1068840 [Tanacetum coccineum]|uniref:Uncharacterized protein n=1 Tax=Tanacetum coccineum TaxID=301880 RepID=A0ABQ5HGW1_9ASTR
MTPRSCLRWKPTGKIFKTVGLRWVPTGKIFTPSTTKVDSEPPNGSNADITNQYESAQTLDVSAGTSNLSAGLAPPRQMTSDHNSSELGIHDHSNELSRSKLVPKVVPLADKTATSRQELKLLFHHHITILRITMLIADIEDDIMDPVMQCTTLSQPFGFLLKETCLIVTRYTRPSNDFSLRDTSRLRCDASIQLKSDLVPHAHAQTTKTFIKQS